MEILIGLIVSLAVGRFIFKGYSASGVLFTGGLALLVITALLDRPVLPANVKSSNLVITDIFVYIKWLLESRSGGLGLMIMTLCGFSKFMTHIGANDMLVKLASRPLSVIKSPYILMVAAYFVACLMSLAVSSAAGLGILLMATLFPLMVNMGISRGAATAICASPAAIILSPTSGDVIIAAEASGMELIDFAFKTTLPISITAIVFMGIAHYFWQRYLDEKEGVKHEILDVSEIQTNAPYFYAILPFSPILGVLFFNGQFAPKLDILTILIICITITAFLEYFRRFDVKAVYAGLEETYKGMAEAFSNVVILLVAAGVFAHGLTSVGFIDQLLHLAALAGNSAFIVLFLLVGITLLAAITTGSGNAPFYAFVELIPPLAAKMGINPAFLIIPMLQSSNLGRTVSPVSGVIVATSGMANISPFETVKRTSVPVIVGLVVIVTATIFMVEV